MWAHLDVEFSVPVGIDEKHLVNFRWLQGPAEAVITVDGVELLRERHLMGMKSVRRYKLTVGVHERHQFVVEKYKRRAYGGLRKQTFRVYLDGRQIAEH